MPRPPKITTEEILMTARQIFLEQGVGASTLAIAQKAGISEAVIFKRFATKQALFLAAMGIDEQPQWLKLVQRQTPGPDIRAELTEICTQMLAFYQVVLPRVMMMMVQNKMPYPPMILPPPVRDSQLLAGYFERAIALGYLRPCSAITLAHVFVGAIVNHVITNNIAHNLPTPPPPLNQLAPEDFTHHLVEALWVGIGTPP
jgi:AcrR family transcriptional regulator